MILLVAKNKLIKWLDRLTFSDQLSYRGWSWNIITEYSYTEKNGLKFNAVMYYKSTTKDVLIYIPKSDNCLPTNKEIKQVIETNYDDLFSNNE